MSTQVQYRRGSAVQVAAFTGALGELVIDTTNKVVVVQDGATVGGFSQVSTTATQTLTNKTLSAATFTGAGTGSGSISLTGNITGAYLFGNASQVTGLSASKIFNGTSEANIGTSGGNANITIGGTSNVVVFATTGEYVTGLLSVTGNITGGNISATNHTGTTVSITGTVTAASTVGGVMTGSSISVTGAVTGASAAFSGASTAASYSATGAVTGTTITGTSLTVSTGNITGGNIVNSNANGVGNIGSSTTYFNTVFAKATSAQYADLAEMYCADIPYSSGIVVEFGGTAEVTATTESHSTRVAGIISTNPSYLMNSTIECENAVAVALTGRVPCRVVGTIKKGDRLVASGLHTGVATALDMGQYQPGCIIGKALEDYNSTKVGTIEVAVGRT
jgi:Major tropism determinant N-terminal domain